MNGQALAGSVGGLEVDVLDQVAWITIDNPDQRNALTPEMWAAVPGLVAALERDPAVRVIGVRGAAGTFSAGADVSQVVRCLTDPQTGLASGGLLTEAEQALASAHKPTVAALEGYCMGGAWMLAGACDLRIASRSLRVGLTPARLGILFPRSGIQALVRLVGPGVASYLLLTGDTVSAEDAERWGMLTKVVDDGLLWAEAGALVERLARNSQLSVQGQKHLIQQVAQGAGAQRDDSVADALYREVSAGLDVGIGQAAFLAKTTPRFTWSGYGFWGPAGDTAERVAEEQPVDGRLANGGTRGVR